MALKSDLTLPADGIKIKLSNVKAFVGEKDFGAGTLCISEDEFIWRMDDGKGFVFNYPQIALHAISSDLNAFPHECLYMIVDKSALNNSSEETRENDNDSAESDDSDEISPLRFVPEDKTFLQPIFRAINECQALHPDPDDISSGEDEGEEAAEEDDENDFRDDEDIQDDEGQQMEDEGVQVDPDTVQLSARGRQIWERLNAASARQQGEANNGGDNEGDDNGDENAQQFQDADISEQ